ETLKLFARLRAIETQSAEEHLRKIIEKFELSTVIHQRVSTYSAGSRRKLSLAIALIGSPHVVLLDEPTTGVDPEARQKIWLLLRDIMDNGNVSMLVTSHHMEECEMLCSKLAIMANGKLKCIGHVND